MNDKELDKVLDVMIAGAALVALVEMHKLGKAGTQN